MQPARLRGRAHARVCLGVAAEHLVETGEIPAGRVIAEEVGISKRMANIHLKALKETGMLEL